MTAQAIARKAETSKASVWAGRILSGLGVAFLLFDGVMKLMKPPSVVQATVQLGYPETAIVGIGVTSTLALRRSGDTLDAYRAVRRLRIDAGEIPGDWRI